MNSTTTSIVKSKHIKDYFNFYYWTNETDEEKLPNWRKRYLTRIYVGASAKKFINAKFSYLLNTQKKNLEQHGLTKFIKIITNLQKYFKIPEKYLPRVTELQEEHFKNKNYKDSTKKIRFFRIDFNKIIKYK